MHNIPLPDGDMVVIPGAVVVSTSGVGLGPGVGATPAQRQQGKKSQLYELCYAMKKNHSNWFYIPFLFFCSIYSFLQFNRQSSFYSWSSDSNFTVNSKKARLAYLSRLAEQIEEELRMQNRHWDRHPILAHELRTIHLPTLPDQLVSLCWREF